MRQFMLLALALSVAACGDAATLPQAADSTASFARGGNANAPLAVFVTQLRPELEIPAPNDSTAWGTAVIKVMPGGVIEWMVQIHNPDGENFTAGHIHRITNANGTGGVAVGLFSGPATTDDHFTVRGSATNAAVATGLLTSPASYYVNFHTTANPAGAIRGNLP